MGGSNQLRLFNQCKVSSHQNDDVYGVLLPVTEGPYFAGFYAQFVHLWCSAAHAVVVRKWSELLDYEKDLGIAISWELLAIWRSIFSDDHLGDRVCMVEESVSILTRSEQLLAFLVLKFVLDFYFSAREITTLSIWQLRCSGDTLLEKYIDQMQKLRTWIGLRILEWLAFLTDCEVADDG